MQNWCDKRCDLALGNHSEDDVACRVAQRMIHTIETIQVRHHPLG
jgi:hypothetical protein